MGLDLALSYTVELYQFLGRTGRNSSLRFFSPSVVMTTAQAVGLMNRLFHPRHAQDMLLRSAQPIKLHPQVRVRS